MATNSSDLTLTPVTLGNIFSYPSPPREYGTRRTHDDVAHFKLSVLRGGVWPIVEIYHSIRFASRSQRLNSAPVHAHG